MLKFKSLLLYVLLCFNLLQQFIRNSTFEIILFFTRSNLTH
ncbi:hypothetical protein Gotur_025548 [Gossypium turneri]